MVVNLVNGWDDDSDDKKIVYMRNHFQYHKSRQWPEFWIISMFDIITNHKKKIDSLWHLIFFEFI